MTRRFPLLLTALTLPLLLIGTLTFVSSIRAGGPYDICSTCTYTTIQQAVTEGPENTSLTIADETFIENVAITRSVTLVGAGSGLTIIDGQITDTVILINSGPTVSISGVTIQNGDTTNASGGGGLLNENGTVTLTNAVVQNNLALDGAGISNKGTMILDNVTVRNNMANEVVGNVSICEACAGGGIHNSSVMTVTNSMVHGNTANFGGGIENTGTLVATNVEIYNNSVSNNVEAENSFGGGIENLNMLTLTDSIVRDNSAPFGGGIYNEGNLTVSGSDLYSNMATTRGGGIHNTFNMTVETSNIHDNEAGSGGGGGISSEGGGVLVQQTAVYNNSATGSGGGIVHNVLAGANSFIIINSTISGNSTQGAGGGLRNAGVASTSLNFVTMRNNQSIVVSGQSVSVNAGTLTLKNSLIATNQSGNNCSGTMTSQGYNIANDGSCGLTGTADMPNTTPLLGPLQDNGGGTLTHALLVGSPAIDSGNGCPAVDQRGVARPFGDECDRGAYEYDQDTQFTYLPLVVRP